MFNPIRYVDNNFEDPHFSDADLRTFCEDHLVRLAQPENNPGSIYSLLLTDTTNKYNAYYGKMSSQSVKEAIAEGATVTRNNARQATEEKISKLNNLSKFKFGEGSSQYQELFPLGAREYQDAREGDVGNLFNRFVTAATTHLTADYPAEVTAISTLVTAFHAAYNARETVVAQVDILITGKNSDRLALTAQLTRNFLIIASDHIGNPDKYHDYYNQSYLPIEAANDRVTANLNPGQTINIFDNISSGTTTLRAKNNSSGKLSLGFQGTENGVVPDVPDTELPAGEEIFREAAEGGWTTENKYLNATNHTDSVISFVVEKV